MQFHLTAGVKNSKLVHHATYLHFLPLVGGVLDDLGGLGSALLIHRGARHFFEQIQSVLVFHHTQAADFALLHDVVRVGL